MFARMIQRINQSSAKRRLRRVWALVEACSPGLGARRSSRRFQAVRRRRFGVRRRSRQRGGGRRSRRARNIPLPRSRALLSLSAGKEAAHGKDKRETRTRACEKEATVNGCAAQSADSCAAHPFMSTFYDPETEEIHCVTTSTCLSTHESADIHAHTHTKQTA